MKKKETKYEVCFRGSKKAIKIEGKSFKDAFEKAVAKGVDFSYADLEGTDLSNLNLTYAKMSGAFLLGTSFQGTYLSGSQLNNAEMIGTNLKGTNLFGANLFGASLRGVTMDNDTDLDYSSGLPFKCGSFDIKASLRLAAQILYHFCRIDFSTCPEAQEIQNSPEVRKLANKFHRAKELGILKPPSKRKKPIHFACSEGKKDVTPLHTLCDKEIKKSTIIAELDEDVTCPKCLKAFQNRVRKFTVHCMTPYTSWEGVEARSEKEAIAKCQSTKPPEMDMNERTHWKADEED